MDAWPPRLRSCTSENCLSQEARILALLEEMRPARRPRELLLYPADPPAVPPSYNTIYPSKLPSYGDVVRVSLVSPNRPPSSEQRAPSAASTLSRCSPRQASFMAAVRNGEERQKRREAQARRRTTVYGDEVYSSADLNHNNRRHDVNHNEEKMISSRRGRPKSYVLATSASLPETDPSSFSHDDTSRDMSSMGSMSSIEPSARSVQPAQSTKSLQKFIALFQKDGKGRLRPKRSRTSLPESRVPLPESTLPLNQVLRQGWLKHQEVNLGKKGSRSQWSSRWAVLSDATLYLCMQPSTSTAEALQLVAPVSRLDVASSVVDISYDWLSQARHVLRLVCQSRSEHLLELLTEADMLSWITALQSAASSSSPESSSVLANSCSAASLASSCSSDRHAAPCPATNQLIMHRYKAKSSQLQSPSSKRASDHNTQPGTSKDGVTENGESTTPKSARKWKKSKANKQGSGSSGGSGPAPSVLGVRLAECVTNDPEEHIPLVVQICVNVVEEHGMDTVGIYRIPGNTAAVNGLKDHLSQGIDTMTIENIDLSDARWRDVNVVSSFLKMFLRKLPEPLLTDKLYPFFIDANRIPSHHNRLHKLRNLLRKLPRAHYCTLRYLIRHLSAISKNSEVNKMETRNVALMFGPSIVRPSDDNMATMVTHMSDQCKIIETLIHYHDWMFDDNSPVDDMVPPQHPSETAEPRNEAPQYGVVNPGGVSAATFNDMHMLIRKANEEQAAALMNEGKTGKIKNMLRRNSRRDKSKPKPKIESTAPAAVHPRYNCTPPQSSVDSAFLGNYQERDIDAEIMSRQTTSPLASTVEQSPSIESSLGSIPDTSRTDPGPSEANSHAEEHKKRQQDMYSARRIFIAGSDNAASSSIDALASHTQHLNTASSPALEVLSEETRAKIRKMQLKQNWMEKPDPPRDHLKAQSPTRDQLDALSCTSDYSTTSSAPLTTPLAVACSADPPTFSDYASSDPSPCANASTSPRPRPTALLINDASRCQQKIKMRSKPTVRDPSRRHTLSDMDAFKEGRLEKFARWIGLRRSSPDVTKELEEPVHVRPSPPVIVRTSPNELTPASGDEQL